MVGDAGEHFKTRRCHSKISTGDTLFANIGGQRLVFDRGNQKRRCPLSFFLRSVCNIPTFTVCCWQQRLWTEFDALKDCEGYRQRVNWNLERV